MAETKKTKKRGTLGSTLLSNSKATKVNNDFRATRSEPQEARKYYCTMCGRSWERQMGHFAKTNSPLYAGNNGFICICRSCLDNYYSQLSNEFFTGDDAEAQAVERICQIMDWPFSPIALDMCDVTHSDSTKIALYPGKINMIQVKRTMGDTYLDTIKKHEADKHMIESHADVERVIEETKDDENQFVVTHEMVAKWSTGMNPDEYQYLEEQYKDWCDKTEVRSKAQEMLIQSICIAQLNMRRAQSGNGKIEVATRTFTDLLANCNLTPKQANDNSMSSSQASFGELIKRIENEEPIPEAEGDFKDPDKIRTYINTFFYGHLAKALHVKNDAEQEYENEIMKYTVVPPIDDQTVNIDSADNNNESEDAGNG